MKQTLSVARKQRNWALIADVTYAQTIYWFNATRRDLKLSLLVPTNHAPGEKFPLLVWMCGGAFLTMDRNVWLPQWTEFARKGCVVASVEYRTSNDAPFPAPLQDVKAAIRYLRAHADCYAIDPERVFVAGESAGGTLAGLVGVYGQTRKYDVGDFLEYSSAVSGVIDFYGVSDIKGSLAEHPFLNLTTMAFLGYTQDEEKLAEASVCEQITAAMPPFLIFHGDADEMVSLHQSERLYEALTAQNIPADLYILKGCGHGAEEFYQAEMLDIVSAFILSQK